MKPKPSKKKEDKGLVLVCDACGYENEPQRVYCHNCAAKLDRSKLPTQDKKAAVQDIKKKEARQRAAKAAQKLVKNLILTPVLAAVTACLVLLFKPPGSLPKVPSQDELLDAPMIGLDLQGLLSSPVMRQATYTEEQVNGFLTRMVRPNEKDAGYIKVQGALAGFSEDEVRLILKLKLYVVPLSVETVRAVEIDQGKLETEVKGGRFGSLPLHPILAGLIDPVFDPLWEELKQEKKQIERLQSIQFEDEKVTFVGGAAAAPAVNAPPVGGP